MAPPFSTSQASGILSMLSQTPSTSKSSQPTRAAASAPSASPLGATSTPSNVQNPKPQQAPQPDVKNSRDPNGAEPRPPFGQRANEPPAGSKGSSGTVTVDINVFSIARGQPVPAPAAAAGATTDPKARVAAAGPPSQRHDQRLIAQLRFPETDPAQFKSSVTMTEIRRKISEKIVRPTPFVFCAEDGSPMPEQNTLQQYLAHLRVSPQNQGQLLAVFVTASLTNPNVIEEILSKPPFYIKFVRVLEQANRFGLEGSLDSSALKGKSPADVTLNELRAFVKTMSVDERQDIFCLKDGTPIQGQVTLRHYLTMADITVDHTEKVPSLSICFKKAGMSVPKTEKEAGLASTGILGGGGGQSKFGPADPAVLAALGKIDNSFTDRSDQELKRDKAFMTISDTLDARSYAPAGAKPIMHTSKMNENDWDSVLRNSGALYGWVIDFKTNKVKRAAHPAFRLRRGLNLEPVKIKSTEKSENNPAERSQDEKTGRKSEEKIDLAELAEYQPVKPNAIPSWIINDRSKIEIASTTHEFQKSMAENHFTATSFEAGVSGSYGPVSAAANAGVASENASAKTSTQKSYTKTLTASYRIPRVTINFPSEDLEPTEELQAALAKIKRDKSLQDLRKLTNLFGNLFAQQILLGGCLQTSKVLSGTETANETMSRSKFKASVGLSVGAMGVGANMKASHEKQDQKEEGEQEKNTQENLSFDATGGNTILAADPQAWLESCADFNMWRVIERAEVVPLVNVIAGIPTFEDVHMWYLQAIPALTKYIVVPQSRAMNVRLKLESEMEGLMRGFYDTSSEEIKVTRESELAADQNRIKTETYLAHNPLLPPQPVRTYIAYKDIEPTAHPAKPLGEMFTLLSGIPIGDMTHVTHQIKAVTYDPIFSPPCTQGPVLVSPKNYSNTSSISGKNDAPKVEADTAPSTTKEVDPHLFTVWRFEIPHGYNLEHNTLVRITSLANVDEREPRTLTVYRNGQGEYQPTITDHPDPSWWRILKASGGKDGDPLKDGESIRLAWRFSDQSSGYRDFKDDYYGRRRFTKPEGTNDELYLKLPFPRFENIEDLQRGTSLIMSQCEITKPVLQKLKVIDSNLPTRSSDVNYNLFDLSFRLDYVSEDAMSDRKDFMNVQWKGSYETMIPKPPPYDGYVPPSIATSIGSAVGEQLFGKIGGLIGGEVGKLVSEIADGPTNGSPLDVIGQIAMSSFTESATRAFFPASSFLSLMPW